MITDPSRNSKAELAGEPPQQTPVPVQTPVIRQESSPPPTYFDDTAYKIQVQELDSALEAYTSTKASSSKAHKRQMEANIEGLMHRLADLHPDPATSKSWRDRATSFSLAREVDKSKHANGLKKISKALLVVCAAPIALTGYTLVATGEIIAGSGRIVNKVAHIFSKDL